MQHSKSRDLQTDFIMEKKISFELVNKCLKKWWGWVLVASSFCNLFASFGLHYCYGLLYIALQEEFNSANAATAWIGSLASGLSCMGALVSSPMVHKFGNRRMAILGTVLTVSGYVATSFMRHFMTLYFTYSLLVGMGLNLILTSSVDLILRYFPEKNATRATCFATAGTTSGMSALNPLIHLIITHWGWRNMLRVMGGLILLIGFPCSTTYIQPDQASINPFKKKKVVHKYFNKDDCGKELTVGSKPPQGQSEVVTDRTFKERLQVLLFPEMWFFVVALLGCSMGQSFYYISFVKYMITRGFEIRDGAMIMAVVALTSNIGKFLLSAIGDNVPFPKIFLFDIASVSGICIMVTLLVVNSLWVIYCLAIVTGLITMAIFDCLLYSISVEVFGPERNTETCTVLLGTYGFGVILGSLFDLSVDSFGSYNVAIYANIGIYTFSIVLYTAIPFYQRLFAKDRYIMSDCKEKRRHIKDEAEKETMLKEKKQVLERTFQSPPTLKPEYVYYEKVSTV